MRLLMYADESGAHLGALQASHVVDLSALAARDGRGPLPPDLLGLIDGGDALLRRVESLLARQDESSSRPLAEVRVLPPLNPPRGNVVAIGRNYAEHAAESARARGEEVQRPTIFTKAQTSIIGPYDDITVDSRITGQVDWEVELGVVLGRRARNVQRAEALDHVFGYTVVNDVSARDLQFGWGGQFFKGKSLDGFCPIGPWIVTRDEVADPQSLRLCLRVNGETKQDSNTRHMIFPVDELIAQLSLGMTLPPGTLIATGTPEGVGMGRTPQEWLRPEDTMESEIEGIGLMRNRIVAAS